MNFSEALEKMKTGKSVIRQGWNGKGMYISAQMPTEKSKMTRPYLYITVPKGSSNHFGNIEELQNESELIPWIPGQNDMFAEDWQVLE